MSRPTEFPARLAVAVQTRWVCLRRCERGAVAEWVLLVVMAAAIVTALLIVAKPLLTNLFQKAVDSVSP